MFGAGCLHLNLAVAVARIDVVKLLLAAQAGVGLHFRVKVFVDVYQLMMLRQLEAQVVQAGVAIVGRHAVGSFFQRVGAQQQDGAEVEVIAQRPRLVVDDGSCLSPAFLQLIMVGINHARIAVFQNAYHTFQSEHT